MSTKVSNVANRRLLQGILTGILQSTGSNELIVPGVLALQYVCNNYEAQHYKLKDSLLSQVLSQSQAKARERKERDVKRALDKASPGSDS